MSVVKPKPHVEVNRSDHHLGRFQGIVAEPEFPYDPAVVAIVNIFRKVFTIQIGLKTA